jgi:putative membrane protein
MMWQYGSGMAGWGPILMTVGNLLFWALVVVGVIVLVRYLRRSTPGGRTSAEELLAERFARGEIDEQEYRERLDVLCRAGIGS